MNEEQFLDLWTLERDMYAAWGRWVQDRIIDGVKELIGDAPLNTFIRIPPELRTKTDDSLIAKAFFREKRYNDPYQEITDKIGTRFVVLLQAQVDAIHKIIKDCPDWSFTQDRDFRDEQARNPILFDYAADHYIVRSKTPLEIAGVDVAPQTPCEIQVKTLLQHAYSELTHDSIYKPRAAASTGVKRSAAKSMALIEAAGDYFERVMEETELATSSAEAASNNIAALYRSLIGRPPSATLVEDAILNAFEAIEGALPGTDEAFTERVTSFMQKHQFISKNIRERAQSQMLYRQPSVLLVYLLADSKPTQLLKTWELQRHYLDQVLIDLGKSPQAYD